MSHREPVPVRLWAVLCGHGVGVEIPLAAILAALDASGPTIRRYLREWACGGFVDYRPGGQDCVVLRLDDPRPPLGEISRCEHRWTCREWRVGYRDLARRMQAVAQQVPQVREALRAHETAVAEIVSPLEERTP